MKLKLIKIIGTSGIVALILAGLVLLLTPSLLYLRSGLIIFGFFSLIAALVLNFKGVRSFLLKKSTRSTSFSFIIVLFVISLLVALNYIAYRYSFRFDFSEGEIHTLSEQSEKIIKRIRSEVMVYGFLKEENRADFEALMKIYQAGNPLIKYRFVDVGSEIDLTKKYDVTYGTVVVETDGKNLRIEERFSESTLTNALLKLQLRMEKKIAFLVGHGERSIHDNDTGGISQFNSTLIGQGYNITEINLVVAKSIPDDIELLIITAPRDTFLEKENRIITAFIAGNGSVIYLQDPQKDLKTPSFIAELGIRILNGTIIDPDAAPFSGGAEIPLVGRYGDHGVTSGLKKESLRTLYPVATALKEDRKIEGLKLTPLAYTSPRSWLESEVAEKVKYDERSDLKGPLIVGLISESQSGKVIVFGDSDFASNQFFLLGANKNLLVNAARYATNEGELISILPKEMRFHQILLSNSQIQLIRFFAGIFIPFSITLCGIRVWWRRRRL